MIDGPRRRYHHQTVFRFVVLLFCWIFWVLRRWPCEDSYGRNSQEGCSPRCVRLKTSQISRFLGGKQGQAGESRRQGRLRKWSCFHSERTGYLESGEGISWVRKKVLDLQIYRHIREEEEDKETISLV